MDREKILENVRNEKVSNDEYEKKIALKSGLVDTLAALIIVLILVISEYCIHRTLNWGVMAVAMSVVCADMLYTGINNRTTWKVVTGVLSGVIALLMVISFFKGLVIK